MPQSPVFLGGFDLDNPALVDQVAWESGYYFSEAKKVPASLLVPAFFQMAQSGKNSLRDWALRIGVMSGNTLHKSSLHDRLGPRTLDFSQALLRSVMEGQMGRVRSAAGVPVVEPGLLGKFGNVFLSDSTCSKLPPCLSAHFPSSHSQGEPTATLRVQAVYNYTRSTFDLFDVGSYRDNDQGAADLVLEVARRGDLVLRDLGYFVLANLRKMGQQGVYFVSKHRPGINFYNPQTGAEINLLTLFKGKNRVDMPVLAGAKEKVPLRLVAQKLPEEVARQKKEKARKDRNKKTNHSEAYYEELEWAIFLTNIGEEMLSAQEVALIYRLRWFIEIVFKAWKSHFNFAKVLNVPKMNYCRTLITIHLMLAHIAHTSLATYNYIKEGVEKITKRPLSILKYLDVFSSLAAQLSTIRHLEELDPLIPQFALHATYEARKKRKNIKELYIC